MTQRTADRIWTRMLRRRQDLAVWLAVSAIVVALLQIPALNRFDRLDLDLLHALRAVSPIQETAPQSDVAIIAIDEASHSDPNLEGIPRVLWTPQIAKVQDAVMRAEALVIGWDIILPNTSAKFIGDTRYDAPLLKSILLWGRRAGKIVLGEAFLGDSLVSPHKGYVVAAGGTDNLRQLVVPVDPDSVVRDLPGFVDLRQEDGTIKEVPGLAAALASRLTGAPIESPPPNAALNIVPDPAHIPIFSFADILACAEDGNTAYLKEYFAGKAVILGVALDVEDRRLAANRFVAPPDFEGAPTLCGGGRAHVGAEGRSTVPGAFLHAMATDNLARQSWLVPVGSGIALSVTALGALLAGLLALAAPGRLSMPVTLAGGLGWTAVATVGFVHSVWLPLIDVWLALLIGWTALFLYRSQTVDRARATMRKSFERYLDETLIKEIADTGKLPELGGERRQMSVLFSDIVSFSTLSEKIEPPEIVRFLNIYFAVVGEEIRKQNGIIERFIGDSVVAVFGAPMDDEDHAIHAVKCALGMAAAVERSAAQFGVPDGFRVAVRIGVNSGDMTVGNVGAEKRFTYTVMGDSVNLAARLESGAKQMGTELLVGSAARDLCVDQIEFREVDRLRVVSRDTPETVYEPLGLKGSVPQNILDRRDAYEAAMTDIRAMRFAEARKALEDLTLNGDPVSAKTLERLTVLEQNPPGADWDGVMELRSK